MCLPLWNLRHPMTLPIKIRYKGQLYALSFSDGSSPTLAELQVEIERVVGVQQDAQRLFQNRRRIDCTTVSKCLGDVCDDAAPLLLMAGASIAQIESMNTIQRAEQRETTIRENRRVVDISKRNQGIKARSVMSTSYRFHALEPLKMMAEKETAYAILETLANDRGILAIMAKHKWSVGSLAEMPPDGKVGVDPVCVLGLNQNKGQKIWLRLRTDDVQGFRKFLSIKTVLLHELAHNVYSEHDNQFYQLMRQLERECSEFDWTRSSGAAIGNSSLFVHEDESSMSVSSGHRLGGKSAPTSRLLNSVPSVSNTRKRMVPETKHGASPVEQRLTPKLKTDFTAYDWDMNDAAAKSKGTTPEQGNTVRSAWSLTTKPKVHAVTVGENVAPLAMRSREARLDDAVRQLQTRHSAETIGKAASLLYTIVSNILSHPRDAKFRSIRTTNRLFQAQVARVPECLDFLSALGFENQSDKVVLVREDRALLSIGHSTLEKLLPVAA